MTAPNEYRFTTSDLAAEFDVSRKTIRKRAKALGLGIDFDGRAGFRYCDADRLRLVESLRPTTEPEKSPAKPRRGKRAA